MEMELRDVFFFLFFFLIGSEKSVFELRFNFGAFWLLTLYLLISHFSLLCKRYLRSDKSYMFWENRTVSQFINNNVFE